MLLGGCTTLIKNVSYITCMSNHLKDDKFNKYEKGILEDVGCPSAIYQSFFILQFKCCLQV
jgi:hypothetical protein